MIGKTVMIRLPVLFAALVAFAAPLTADPAHAQERRERWDQRRGDWEGRSEARRRFDAQDRSSRAGEQREARRQPRYEPEDRARGYPEPRALRQGGYLPPAYENGRIEDYGRYRLRPPPRGYAWVRAGRGYALVSLQTGQVFEVVPD